MIKAKRDIYGGIAFLLAGIVYFVQTFSIRQTSLVSITSTALPRFCCAVLVVLAVMMLLNGWKELKKNPNEERTQDEIALEKKQVGAVALSFLALGVGIFLMEQLGFVYGMAVYLFCSFLQYSRYYKKNYILFAVIAIAVPVITYVVFSRGFSLRLPEGIFDIGGGIF